MSKVLVTESYLNNIASAIRTKNGQSASYSPSQMASAILQIPSGSSMSIITKSISSNGIYNAISDGADAYWQVVVDVPTSASLPSAEGVLFGTVTPTPDPPTPPGPDPSYISPSITEAYMNDSTITSFYDSSVTSIGDRAFKSCVNLSEVSFPSVTTIGAEAFRFDSLLESISFPLVETIGESAFVNCLSITSISFPEAVTIGSYAFAYDRYLESVFLPKATTIGHWAFISGKFQSIDLPNVTTMDEAVFCPCPLLETVSAPKLQTLEFEEFCYCPKISTLSFPKLIAMNGGYNFFGCTSLMSLYLMNSVVCSLNSDFSAAFKRTPMIDSTLTGSYGSIYVPQSLVSDYHAADNWSVYSDRIVGI